TIGSQPTLARISRVFVEALVPVSASAALIARSLQLNFDNGVAEVHVPGLSLPNAAFVGEAAAIPVQSGTLLADAVLAPYKLALLVTLTREMMEGSNAEALVRATLLSNVGPSLDNAFFNANAGVPAVSPPGLLYGITPITGTAGGGLNAMAKDIADLA